MPVTRWRLVIVYSEPKSAIKNRHVDFHDRKTAQSEAPEQIGALSMDGYDIRAAWINPLGGDVGERITLICPYRGVCLLYSELSERDRAIIHQNHCNICPV